MTQRIINTNHSICRTILLLLVLCAVATPHAAALACSAAVSPRGPASPPYPMRPSPLGSTVDPIVPSAMTLPEVNLPLPGMGTGGCCAPPNPFPVQPTAAWPPGYPSPIVVDDDPTRWVACLNAQNAARLSRLFEIAGAPGNVMELPGTSDPCSELNTEPMGWTPGWNLPDPRPAYIIREGRVLITIPDWGGPR